MDSAVEEPKPASVEVEEKMVPPPVIDLEEEDDDVVVDRPADTETELGESTPVNVTAQLEVEVEPEDEDDDNKDELSPPPDTPPEETEVLSEASEPPAVGLADEIVVGTNANHSKSSPPQPNSEPEDVDMDEVEDSVAPQIGKRKRVTYNEDVEEITEVAAVVPEPAPRPRVGRPPKNAHAGGNASAPTNPGVKGVVLGYWRDSAIEDPADRHAVIGFMDARDRLRTRVQTQTRDGRAISSQFPIPPGPGGSWVTFDKIVFDNQLVNLDHHQVKEYVKIRAENTTKTETPEMKKQLDTDAVKEAIRRVQENPPPETNQAVLIAYGPTIPEHAQVPHRSENKRRKIMSLGGGAPTESSPAPLPANILDNIPGTRPTRVLLGFWRRSSEEQVADKHAVYGILGANDMFRVKLMRETRDGRPVMGNFPMGPGALWIHWDEVEFEPHLRDLPRTEIKEYCRVRQRQIDDGESPEERIANETKAVFEAQQRVANASRMIPPGRGEMYGMQPIAKKDSPALNGNGPEDDYVQPGQYTPVDAPYEPRPTRRVVDNAPRMRHSLPDVELRAANRPQSVDALERTNNIAHREIARAEAAQQRANQRAANREGSFPASLPGQSGPGNNNREVFDTQLSRLNKVWASQEANRMRAEAGDAKMYMGIKYERKQNGPFQGKLVSQGTIISIDGEDYVEYRVLTKPSFF